MSTLVVVNDKERYKAEKVRLETPRDNMKKLDHGRGPLFGFGFAGLITVAGISSSVQSLTGPPAAPKYKYSTSLLPGMASPDTVETRLGTLKFFDGFPDKATVEELYDNLDFERAVQTYL